MDYIRVDPHVHCRDGKQAYKTTIKEVFALADSQGVKKIFDMPNTDPPITLEKHVKERLELVPPDRKDDYYLYIGATSDETQLEEAVYCYYNYPQVIGIKMFAGKSVGDLEIVELENQRKVYNTLTELGYGGVLAVHCEKESFMRPKVWDPEDPITHSKARPREAEIGSVEDQIDLVKETKFRGKLHICHISVPEAVNLVDSARDNMKITCAATPHHLKWDSTIQNLKNGLMYKMNPPLRSVGDTVRLRKYTLKGKIDWIETDHAPHTEKEKLEDYMSGYPSLTKYNELVDNFLPNLGASKELIKKLTHDNIYNTFKNKL